MGFCVRGARMFEGGNEYVSIARGGKMDVYLLELFDWRQGRRRESGREFVSRKVLGALERDILSALAMSSTAGLCCMPLVVSIRSARRVALG